jgi:hypothetical protein
MEARTKAKAIIMWREGRDPTLQVINVGCHRKDVVWTRVSLSGDLVAVPTESLISL